MAVVIKNVSDGTWRKFKSEAARNGYKLGEFFSIMVEEHLKKNKDSESLWESLLNDKPFLTDEEAKIMHKASKDFRKSFKLGR